MLDEKAMNEPRSRGGHFFTTVLQRFYVDEPQGQLLAEAARTIDLIDKLADDPANAREVRAQRALLVTLIRHLNLGEDLVDADLNPMDREPVETVRTARARKAAQSRWAHHVKRRDLPK